MMADLGNVVSNEVGYPLLRSEPTDTRHLTRKVWDVRNVRLVSTQDIEDGFINLTSSTFEFIKKPISLEIPWYTEDGNNEISVDVQLSADAVSLYPLEKPAVYIDNEKVAEGVVTSSRQTITINYNNDDKDSIPKPTIVTLVYYSHYHYLAKCTWFIDNTNGVVDSIFNTLSGGGGGGAGGDAVNCSYPIGEERPIDYGLITLTGQDTINKNLTFTIPAGTVGSDKNDAQILLTLSPYGSNANGTIEDIFTELGTTYIKVYVKDGTTSLKIDVESWNSVDNFAKLWVTIPLLTTAAKDIVLEYDLSVVDNPDSTMFTVIGF